MTALAKSADWISPEEYLAGERNAEVRHEYVDGQVYAMAGTTKAHGRIAANLMSLLLNHLRGHRCEPFATDLKVRIPSQIGTLFYYPDVVVTCAPEEADDEYYLNEPTIIAEVISDSTEQIDRREKMLAYRQVPTMQIYVIIEQTRIAATVLRRAEQGWSSEVLEGPDAILRLEPIEFEIPLRTLYERTRLAAAAE